MKEQIGLARTLLILSAAFLLSAIAPTSARAGFTFTVQSVSATAGSLNNTLNVTLTNTGSSAVTVGGFAFEIVAGSGVTFTSVDISTTLPYIFAGQSGFGPDISNQPPNLPGNTLAALDFFSTFGSGISLGAGSTVGLGDVHFNVASTATSPISITFAAPPVTNLSDAAGHNISLATGTTFTGGTVTMQYDPRPSPSRRAWR